MTKEPDDAWTTIPPVDRLAGVPSTLTRSRPGSKAGSIDFTMALKGTQVILFMRQGDDGVELTFHFRRQQGAWQLYSNMSSGSYVHGPPCAEAGALLEKFVAVMQGADPRIALPDLF